MKKVVKIGKMAACLVSLVILTVLNAKVIYAQTYEYKQYGSTDFISWDQFNQLVGALSSSVSDDTSQSSTPLHGTGLLFQSYQEAVAAEESFRYLFQGERDFLTMVGREGSYGSVNGVARDSTGRAQISYHFVPGSGPYTIFVGWLPGSNPEKCMAEHNEAIQMIAAVTSSAPEDSCSAYKYFNDWLCQNVCYDHSFNQSSRSGYGALCTGSSVCAGYAKAFMGMCFYAGRHCITISGTKGGGSHSWNAVRDGDTYKWIDVTWSDQDSWIDYNEFMSEMEDNWVTYFNEPFCTVKDETAA